MNPIIFPFSVTGRCLSPHLSIIWAQLVMSISAVVVRSGVDMMSSTLSFSGSCPLATISFIMSFLVIIPLFPSSIISRLVTVFSNICCNASLTVAFLFIVSMLVCMMSLTFIFYLYVVYSIMYTLIPLCPVYYYFIPQHGNIKESIFFGVFIYR